MPLRLLAGPRRRRRLLPFPGLRALAVGVFSILIAQLLACASAPPASVKPETRQPLEMPPPPDAAPAVGEAQEPVTVAEAGPEPADAGPEAEAVIPRRRDDLSFLVITVDTLRPDLGCMGYERPVSPNIDKLSQRSVVYDHAYSISTYTGFCLPPMMASRYPSEMPRNDRHEVKFLSQNVMLAERLRANGFHTAGAASHFLFSPALGWIDGFERFDRVPVEGAAPPGSSVDAFHSSRGLADDAIRMLSDPKIVEGKFFMWIHFLDPHKQYLEHKGFTNFGRDDRGLYDGEIAYTDFHIGRVLDSLAASPLHDRTVVILTADHAEAFGEHGESGHGRHIWEEIVHIPLMVFVPGAAPRRIERRMSVVEIAPTILDLAGLPEDPGARGHSFVAELFGGDVAERPVLIDQPRNPYYPLKRAFIQGGYKLHFLADSKTYLLFDLVHDPGEQNDLASSQPDTLAGMREAYESLMATIPIVTPVPAAATSP